MRRRAATQGHLPQANSCNGVILYILYTVHCKVEWRKALQIWCFDAGAKLESTCCEMRARL